MINFIQLIFLVFILGFGIGSALYLFVAFFNEELDYRAKIEVANITKNAWFEYFKAINEENKK